MRGHRQQPFAARTRRAGGFSLVEMLVGLAVTSMLLLAIVGVFDAGSKVARVETQTTDLQQSLRASHRQITRYVRMAGRGGLPLSLANSPVYQGPALSLRNAAGVAPDNGELAIGYADTPLAIQGTDILITRGVFTTPVYQVNTLDPDAFKLFNMGVETDDPTLATDGTIVIRSMTPTGLPQDLTPLDDAVTGNIPEALILMSPMDERTVAVVELDFAKTAVSAGGAITVAFKVRGLTANHEGYRDLYDSGTGPDPVLPVGMKNITNIGIVEEYRFYIRKPPPPLPGLPDDTPKLSMARMYPGTEIPYLETLANAAVDLADNVLDMQASLAFDTPLGPAATDKNGDTVVDEDDMEIYENLDPEDPADRDDYLFNNPNDNPAVAPWNGAEPRPKLYFMRLNLLARTALRERNRQAPELFGYEDIQPLRILAWNSFEERMYKRRFQQTIIELRNL